MGSIASLSDLVNKLTGGNDGNPEQIWFYKGNRANGGAVLGTPGQSGFYSYWTVDGNPSGGAVPTTVENPTNATSGGLRQTNPGGGRQKWIQSICAASHLAGTLILYDRLLHIGGLSGTVTTSQTVGGTLTRYTNGVGNIAFTEIYTNVGTTTTSINMDSYTDQDNNTGQVGRTVLFPNGFNVTPAVRFLVPSDEDTGVRAVASVDLVATTGTAGNFGVTIGHPLLSIELQGAGIPAGYSFVHKGMPEVLTDACLAWLWRPADASAWPQNLIGCVQFVEA
jgi:hypothetical protein